MKTFRQNCSVTNESKQRQRDEKDRKNIDLKIQQNPVFTQCLTKSLVLHTEKMHGK